MPIQDACGDALSLASSGAERQQLLQAAAEALERLNREETCGDLEPVIYWWFRGEKKVSERDDLGDLLIDWWFWMVAWWFYSRIGGGLVKAIAGKCGFLVNQPKMEGWWVFNDD